VNDTAYDPEPAYHLFLDSAEAEVARAALRLFISDEARESHIRELARQVIELTQASPDEHARITVPLSAEQMKITHSAVKLLLDDLQRHQADERAVLWRILDKLPDEHTMRAIELK
jgi:hypothetical protein